MGCVASTEQGTWQMTNMRAMSAMPRVVVMVMRMMVVVLVRRKTRKRRRMVRMMASVPFGVL